MQNDKFFKKSHKKTNEIFFESTYVNSTNPSLTIWDWDKEIDFQKKDLTKKTEVQYKKKTLRKKMQAS